ncbi:beta-N-acetylhexosaminidase [Roseibium denhamense]|uniref:beta-N-acetylhexosaminidase n=1 Tax=Roseibium denhamense TaxID=76305 RepID=A0ABY1PF02_9HYPH|nr:beta-N-acetylhexosaminidase [Roseibium denhamense]MTI06167.1 beta-N-acetylhexosaminidase [Roseibium denhamense]SMP32347.1 beta-N-acetylhexosaminidase [Roseibium denhamense]
MTKAFISGCAGLSLSQEERSFFEREDPWGLILFARNIQTPAQVKALTADFRNAVGRENAPVLVDQEGGRVQRLKPPHWPKYPAGQLYGDLFERNEARALRAARLGGHLIASDLEAVGITIDCLPCLDVRFPDTVDAIGDRALSGDPQVIIKLAREMIAGVLEGGVLPVIKHIPGHGRARVDSHLELPRVTATLEELRMADFLPFKAFSGATLGMTAHIVYEAIDSERPCTQSRAVIEDIIREEIGFDGCLMSDDLSMNALQGDFSERAAATIEAGCDIILHCNGDMGEMEKVAMAVPNLQGDAARRCEAALAQLQPSDPAFDLDAARDEFASLTGLAVA